MKGLLAFLLIVAGVGLAAGHIVWAQWYSGVLVGEWPLYRRAADGPVPALRTHELRLQPEMNPVVITLTGALANVEAAARTGPLAVEFDTRVSLDGKPFASRRITLAVQPDASGRFTELPAGAEIARIPTPDEGRYAIAIEPVGRPAATLTALSLVVRRNVVSVSWGIVIAGAFLAIVGVMGLRAGRDNGPADAG